jgi:hypothetical protein
MRVSVVKLNLCDPSCDAVTENEIRVAFRPPTDGSISLSDQLDLNLACLDAEQDAANLTTGRTVRLRINSQDVWDLRLPPGRWPSRFPSPERLAERPPTDSAQPVSSN